MKKTNVWNRLLSWGLCVCMVLSMMHVVANAAEDGISVTYAANLSVKTTQVVALREAPHF